MSFWDRLVERAESLGEAIVEWGILIIAALLVLIIGRWIIKWIRNIVERLLGAAALDGVWRTSGVAKATEGTDQTPASVVATVVYAYLMVVLLLIAARILRMGAIEDLLERLLAWVPILLLAAVIVIIAAAAARWVRNLVEPFAERQNVAWLGTAAYLGVLISGILFALDLLDIQFAEDIVKILMFAVGAAFAIAFGIGGIDAGKKWWAKYGTPKGASGGGAPGGGSSGGVSSGGGGGQQP